MTELPNAQGAYALLIGVQRYAGSPDKYQELPASRGSVERLRELLTDTSEDKVMWGLPSAQVVAPEEPNADTARLALKDVLSRADIDTLLVCVSCHGKRFDSGFGPEGLHLAMSNSDFDSPGTHWYFAELQRDLERAHSKGRIRQILLIVDACYANDLEKPGGQGAAPAAPADELTVPGVTVLSATKYWQQAWPKWKRTRHTAFLGALIETIEEGIPGPDEVLSATQVFSDAKRRMSLEKPDGQDIPEPDMWLHGAGQFPLCRNRSVVEPVEVESAGGGDESLLDPMSAEECFGLIGDIYGQGNAENAIQGTVKNFCGNVNVPGGEVAALVKLLAGSKFSSYIGSIYRYFCLTRDSDGIAAFIDGLHRPESSVLNDISGVLRDREDGGQVVLSVYESMRKVKQDGRPQCGRCFAESERLADLIIEDDKLSRTALAIWR